MKNLIKASEKLSGQYLPRYTPRPPVRKSYGVDRHAHAQKAKRSGFIQHQAPRDLIDLSPAINIGTGLLILTGRAIVGLTKISVLGLVGLVKLSAKGIESLVPASDKTWSEIQQGSDAIKEAKRTKVKHVTEYEGLKITVELDKT